MYEPSKELIEQIAEEVYELNKCNLGWEDEIDFVKHHKLSFQNAKNYCKLPTFNKALELYETIPDESKKYCIFVEDSPAPYECPLFRFEHTYYPKGSLYELVTPKCGFSGIGLDSSDMSNILKCSRCLRPYKGEE